jgi:hypothetical protein
MRELQMSVLEASPKSAELRGKHEVVTALPRAA